MPNRSVTVMIRVYLVALLMCVSLDSVSAQDEPGSDSAIPDPALPTEFAFTLNNG